MPTSAASNLLPGPPATGHPENVPAKLSVSDQLDRASTSIALNIAEGNGKYTRPDRCRYFEIARGSALESAACLDVLVAKGKSTPDQVQPGKALLHEIVSLLIGLIKSLSPDRLGEDPLPYRTSERLESKSKIKMKGSGRNKASKTQPQMTPLRILRLIAASKIFHPL